MTSDKLKTNEDNTEVVLIGSRQQLAKVRLTHIKLGNVEVLPISCVRNLGVWLHLHLVMIYVDSSCTFLFRETSYQYYTRDQAHWGYEQATFPTPVKIQRVNN